MAKLPLHFLCKQFWGTFISTLPPSLISLLSTIILKNSALASFFNFQSSPGCLTEDDMCVHGCSSVINRHILAQFPFSFVREFFSSIPNYNTRHSGCAMTTSSVYLQKKVSVIDRQNRPSFTGTIQIYPCELSQIRLTHSRVMQ